MFRGRWQISHTTVRPCEDLLHEISLQQTGVDICSVGLMEDIILRCEITLQLVAKDVKDVCISPTLVSLMH